MSIEILNGNFGTEQSAYNFGRMLSEELLANGVDTEVQYQPYTTDEGSGVKFYGFTEDEEEIIYTAIEDTFSRSDMWEEDEEEI